MTVADLIRDLQTMPQHLPVKAVISSVYLQDGFDPWGSSEEERELDELDALPVYRVTFEGGFVLVRGEPC